MIRDVKNTNIPRGKGMKGRVGYPLYRGRHMKRDTEMHLQWHCSTPTFSEFLNTQDGGMHSLFATRCSVSVA